MPSSEAMRTMATTSSVDDGARMAGAAPWAAGWWWTLLTGVYLHGSLLHILFNMLWVRQLAPAVEQLYGSGRLAVIYTVAGVAGFALSNAVGIRFTLGASGAVFGLLGAMVAYGRSRGGAFGRAATNGGTWRRPRNFAVRTTERRPRACRAAVRAPPRAGGECGPLS